MAKRRIKRKYSSRSHSTSYFSWRRLALKAILVFMVVFGIWALYLDYQVKVKFDGKKWAIPARVYAQPLEVYQGLLIKEQELESELKALGYQFTKHLSRPGQVVKGAKDYQIYTRSFTFWDEYKAAAKYRLQISGGQVIELSNLNSNAIFMRLEPQEIGSIYPNHGEDRILLRLTDIPPYLGEALIAVEDKNFLRHHGISLKGIARAIWVNIKAGGVVQGGSTITQQLVKNFYLTHKRSLWRKIQEAMMALLLEWRYNKADILEAYINEVYLGQSGARGIHGFGLAAQHYFNQSLQELQLHQIALIVGVVKGASYYNPWRYPERAIQRRNLVLQLMADNNLISEHDLQQAQSKKLGIVASSSRRLGDYPAFLDLVKRQLSRDYRQQDLQSEGLRIFTTMVPNVQIKTESSVLRTLKVLNANESNQQMSLQAAAIITAVGSGEVLAVVGDKNPRFSGFNRALDAQRPVGSLIKPVVYLTALSQPERYHLMTPLDDNPLTVKLSNGDQWQPRNFSRKSHGKVSLYKALALSYNQATARLGMTLGVDKVANVARQLGMPKSPKPLPSLLLGSVSLSPLEVSHMYHTLAADGVYTPLRAILSVLTSDGQPLQRYPLNSEIRISSEQAHLMHYNLQAAMRIGTGKNAYNFLPSDLVVAGKTGTTNEQRDSWFAGYSGDHLGVIWIGKDDNSPTDLTGSSGALVVWADIFSQLSTSSLTHDPPPSIQYFWMDSETGLRSHENCRGAQLMPFISGSEPQRSSSCEWLENPVKHWLKQWF